MAGIETMLVAVWHLQGSEHDAVSNRPLDVSDDRRQGELREVVTALARWQPTKVAVEFPMDQQARLDARFAAQQRSSGPVDLTEIGQIGCRLARRLAHGRVIAIDVQGSFYEQGVEELLADARHARTWRGIIEAAEAITAEIEQRVDTGTILEVLHWLNRPESLRNVTEIYYERTASITDPRSGSYAGADMVANFYRRNLHIAANLGALVERGDRVAVLIGHSHVPFLAHILGSSGHRLADPLPYLDPPAAESAGPSSTGGSSEAQPQ